MFVFSFFLSIREVLEVLWKGERDASLQNWPGPDTVTRGKVPAGKDLELQGEAKILTFRSEAISERPLFLLFAPGVLPGGSLPSPVATGTPLH